MCILASFDTLLKFLLAGTESPNLRAYLREMFELEECAGAPPLLLSDKRSGLSVDSACKEMSNGRLDLISVKTLYISTAKFC